ncbi:MAG: sulfatase-like hydrolase/transferase [Anaerolineales bacterium]|nr:sulfatase-like hydrolase/transferase [Anaerolineales bacterium]
MTHFSRRDFLKLMALSSAGIAASVVRPYVGSLQNQNSGKPNILVFVLDAMATRNMSLYGYQRETTPNLTRLASRANVYHAHYSAANASSPGTATLLSGLHPWNHRAINLGGLVRRELVDHNIFRLMGNEYYKVAFTQNAWADLLLRQYQKDLDVHIPVASFSYKTRRPTFSPSIPSDQITTYYAFDEFLSFNYKIFNPLPGSLLLGSLGVINEQVASELNKPSEEYPFGTPSNEFFFYFHNDEVFAGVSEVVHQLMNPVLPIFGYFHLFAPHGTYCPRKEFVGIFPEIDVPYKPAHPLSIMQLPMETLYEYRKHYDEYIADVDAEFGKMMDAFDRAGILDNSYIVVTSDHGQIFERGEFAHGTYLLYDPVIHIPLIISSPGQKERADIFSPTSSTDILPTLLSLAGKDIPGDLGRHILPGLGGREDFQRSIFAIEAKATSVSQPITQATITLMKEGKKLIYYTGYAGYPEAFELYDLVEDSEEIRDLFTEDTATVARMEEEILFALAMANRPFAGK